MENPTNGIVSLSRHWPCCELHHKFYHIWLSRSIVEEHDIITLTSPHMYTVQVIVQPRVELLVQQYIITNTF